MLRWKNAGGEVTVLVLQAHGAPAHAAVPLGRSRTISTGHWPGGHSVSTTSWTSRCPGASTPRRCARTPGGPPETDEQYPVLVREYHTPKGALRHEVRQTGEDQAEGWVIQPETRSSPRGLQHPARGPPRRERARGRGAGWPSATGRPMPRPGPGLPTAWTQVKQVPATGRESRCRRGRASAWMPWSGSAAPRGRSCSPWTHRRSSGSSSRRSPKRTSRGPSWPRRTPASTSSWNGAGIRRPTSGPLPSSSSSLFPTSAPSRRPRIAHGKKFAYVMTTGVEVLGPRARGGRGRRAVLRGPAGPGPEGTFAGEGAGPALGVHDPGRRNQLDCPEQQGQRGHRSRRETRPGRARARPTGSSCIPSTPCSPTHPGSRWRS